MVERPLECSQCKKSADVIYSEIAGKTNITTHMCRDCPVLKQKLYGKPSAEPSQPQEKELCCCKCQTTLASVLMGEPLGCKECYTVFEDILFDQLRETELISPRLKSNPTTPSAPLHIGKTPYSEERTNQSTKLRDLNQSLREALQGENYEEAAWLRDQIHSLTQNKTSQDGIVQ